MDDNEIIALYRGRDERAISETMAKYGGYCGTVAMNILGVREDAEECVNDTCLAAWTRIPPAAPACLRVFLGRITRNISISRWRKSHAAKRYSGIEIMLSELEECIPDVADTAGALESAELSEIISGWLDTLDSGSRALFVRRYWYGESVSELAKKRGVRPQQITQKLLRLRRRLKVQLESEGVIL